MKRNGSSYSWLSITQIWRKTKRWNKFVQGNESSSYRMWKFCSEGSFALKVVCEIVWFWEVQFFEYSNYREITVFMNFHIFFLSKILQKYLKSWLSFLFLFINCGENISLSHQGNKIGELKFIQCLIGVSFQGQRNPQNCKNPSKITSFKA